MPRKSKTPNSPPVSKTSAPGNRVPKARHLALVTGNQQGAEKTEGPVAKTKVRSAIIPHLGLTEKQEAYCQGVTSGLSLSDAYRQAYNTQSMAEPTIHQNACRMFCDSKISARIKQINREKEEQRRVMAASDAAFALGILRKMAEQADSDATKVRAAELVAKAAGVFTEQLEITDKTDKTEEELEQAIAQRLARLGLAPKAV